MNSVTEKQIGEHSKIVILRCSDDTKDVVNHMDNMIKECVGNNLYNLLVAKTLDNPYVRIIIIGINELPWFRLGLETEEQTLLGYIGDFDEFHFWLMYCDAPNSQAEKEFDEITNECIKRNGEIEEYTGFPYQQHCLRLLLKYKN